MPKVFLQTQQCSLHTLTVHEMDTNASCSPWANLIWVIECSRSLENGFHIRCSSADTWNLHFIYLHYRFLLSKHLTEQKNLFLSKARNTKAAREGIFLFSSHTDFWNNAVFTSENHPITFQTRAVNRIFPGYFLKCVLVTDNNRLSTDLPEITFSSSDTLRTWAQRWPSALSMPPEILREERDDTFYTVSMPALLTTALLNIFFCMRGRIRDLQKQSNKCFLSLSYTLWCLNFNMKVLEQVGVFSAHFIKPWNSEW